VVKQEEEKGSISPCKTLSADDIWGYGRNFKCS